jgi:hypothetical protein
MTYMPLRRFDASTPVALLFIAAMPAFFLGLLWLLRAIYTEHRFPRYTIRVPALARNNRDKR